MERNRICELCGRVEFGAGQSAFGVSLGQQAEECSRQRDASISAGKSGWPTSLGSGLGVWFFEKQKDTVVPLICYWFPWFQFLRVP